ncbi:hypothetical protein ACIP9G_00335 [Lysinibacillus sp. NPDC093197]|uniref:hypothetical protein n=1 Tax=Lysinibacillus sp. NPDC093197 TaxID=3364132 RepID=UPI003824114B
MLKEKKELNRYQLDKAIKKYHDNMCKYMRMKDELVTITAAASSVQYGIEAIMPKAVGGTSDLVHTHVQNRAAREVRINKIKEELLLVQNLTSKVAGDIEQEVLYWLLEGMPFRWIGAKLNMSHISVQRVRVIYLMMK